MLALESLPTTLLLLDLQHRVIGPLSNAPEFQQAFAGKAGSAMVRPPEQRCAVW